MSKARAGRVVVFMVCALLPGTTGWAGVGDPERGTPQVSVNGPSTVSAFLSGSGGAGFMVENNNGTTDTYSLTCEYDTTYVTGCTVPPPTQVTVPSLGMELVIVTFTTNSQHEGTGWVRLRATDAYPPFGTDTASVNVIVWANADPEVTPDAGTHTTTFPALGESVQFDVKNVGSQHGTFDWSCEGSGVMQCASGPGTLFVAAGQTTPLNLSYGTADSGSGTLTLTVTHPNGNSDTGVYTVTVAPGNEPGVPTVTPTGSAPGVEPSLGGTVSFDVTNPGTGNGIYNFSCTPGGSIQSCSPTIASSNIGSGGTLGVSANFTAGSGTGIGTVTLRAEVNGDPSKFGTGAHNVSVTLPAPTVTDFGGPLSVPEGSNNVAAPFYVTNNAVTQQTIALSCSAANQVSVDTCPTSIQIDGRSQEAVYPTFNTAQPGAGELRLWATLDGSSDNEPHDITVTAAAVDTTTKFTIDLGPNWGSQGARDKSACVRAAAGPEGAYQCGELRMAHSMPAFTTLGQGRTATLTYTSGRAHPFPTVMADLTANANMPAVDSLIVKLKLNGQVTPFRYSTAGFTPGQVRRISVGRPLMAGEGGTGIYTYTLEVLGYADDAVCPGCVAEADGSMSILDGSDSEFGAGWELGGTSRLYPDQPGDGLLLTTAEGSSFAYTKGTGETWTSQVHAPNTIYATASFNACGGVTGVYYVRELRNKLYVLYGMDGRQRWVVDRNCQKVEYTYTSLVGLGAATLDLPGTAGNYLSLPDSDLLDVEGDLDVRVWVKAYSHAPSSAEAFVAKWKTPGQQRSYRFDNTGDTPTLVWSTDGIDAVSHPPTATLSSVGVSAGEWVQLRATLDVDNDASGYEVEYFWRTDEGDPWFSLGTPIVGTGTTEVFAGTASIAIGASEEGGTAHLRAELKRVQVRSGIDGDLALGVDFREPAAYSVGQTGVADIASGGFMTILSSGSPASTVLRQNKTVLAGVSVAPHGIVAPYTFSYDANGFLTSVNDPAHRTMDVTVVGGRLDQIEDPGHTGEPVRYIYDGESRIVGWFSRMNRAWGYGYGAGSVLTSVAGPESFGTTFTSPESVGFSTGGVTPLAATGGWDVTIDGPRTDLSDETKFRVNADGAPTEIEDALGNPTYVSYQLGRPGVPTSIVHPNGRTTTAQYDNRGNVSTLTDNGTGAGTSTTLIQRNHATWPDMPTRITQPTGEWVDFEYDAANGNRIAQQDARGAASRVTYSYHTTGTLSGLLASVDAPGAVPPETVLYDANGNVREVKTPMGFRTVYLRDSYGNVKEQQVPIDTAQTQWRITKTTYDAMNRPDSVRDIGPATSYTLPGDTLVTVPSDELLVVNEYDADGNRWKVTRTPIDETGSFPMEIERTFDGLGRQTSEEVPNSLMGIDSTFYDPAGNVLRSRTRRGYDVTMSYDALNRLVERVTPAVTHDQTTCDEHEPFWGQCSLVFPLYPTSGSVGASFGLHDFGSAIPNLLGEFGIEREDGDRLEVDAPASWDPNDWAIGDFQRMDFASNDGTEHTLFRAELDTSNWIRIWQDGAGSFRATVKAGAGEYTASIAKAFSAGAHLFVMAEFTGGQLTIRANTDGDPELESATTSVPVSLLDDLGWTFHVGSDQSGATGWTGAVSLLVGDYDMLVDRYASDTGAVLDEVLSIGDNSDQLRLFLPDVAADSTIGVLGELSSSDVVYENFDSGSISGWTSMNGTAGSYEFHSDAGNYNGVKGLRVNGTNYYATFILQSPAVTLQPDTRYRVHLYGERQQSRLSTFLWFRFLPWMNQNPNGDFLPYSQTFRTGPTSAETARLELGARGSSPSGLWSRARYDDFRVTPYNQLSWSIMSKAGQGSLVVPADTATFTYDAVGNMLTADNTDARISRTYYGNGAVKTDSIRIRDYQDGDFEIFKFGQTHTYDLSGRRRTMDLPVNIPQGGTGTTTYAYNGIIGALESVTNQFGHVYSFQYDELNRPRQIDYPGSIRETLEYDHDGRLLYRDKRSTSGGYVLNADSIFYDPTGRITRGKIRVAQPWQETLETHYSGLGHVVGSYHQRLRDSSNTYERFRYDALGNMQFSQRSSYAGANPPNGEFHPGYTYLYLLNTGQLLERNSVEVGSPQFSGNYPEHMYRQYDAAGNVEFSGQENWFSTNPQTDPTLQLSDAVRYFYGADDKLVAMQKYAANDTNEFGTWEEYRYDALGRRVLVRNRPDQLCNVNCVPFVQRNIWDGDNLLFELRTESSDATEAANPHALEALWTPNSTDYGRVSYTHALGIDRPLEVNKDGSPASVHYNWRGMAEAITDPSGNPWCDLGNICPTPSLPGAYTTVYRGSRGASGQNQWWGSLLTDQLDQSGLLHRRNRYYDPVAGTFTQEDPIGLAGGLNLYGFANGDPVNFSDPFGLAPCPPDCDVRDAADLAAGFTPGVSTGVDFTTLVTGVNPITGDKAGLLERGFALGGLVTPASGASIGVGSALIGAIARGIAKSLGKNRVSIKTVDGFKNVDLAGRAHGGVATPHVQTLTRNSPPGRPDLVNFSKSEVTPATMQDLREVKEVLRRRGGND